MSSPKLTVIIIVIILKISLAFDNGMEIHTEFHTEIHTEIGVHDLLAVLKYAAMAWLLTRKVTFTINKNLLAY